jgi:hypothetical protein
VSFGQYRSQYHCLKLFVLSLLTSLVSEQNILYFTKICATPFSVICYFMLRYITLTRHNIVNVVIRDTIIVIRDTKISMICYVWFGDSS